MKDTYDQYRLNFINLVKYNKSLTGNARKSNKHKSNQKSTRKVNAKFVEREREESDKEVRKKMLIFCR